MDKIEPTPKVTDPDGKDENSQSSAQDNESQEATSSESPIKPDYKRNQSCNLSIDEVNAEELDQEIMSKIKGKNTVYSYQS